MIAICKLCPESDACVPSVILQRQLCVGLGFREAFGNEVQRSVSRDDSSGSNACDEQLHLCEFGLSSGLLQHQVYLPQPRGKFSEVIGRLLLFFLSDGGGLALMLLMLCWQIVL